MIVDIFNDIFRTVVANPTTLCTLFLVYWVFGRLSRFYDSPLRKEGIPGPILGKITSWYRVYYVLVRRNWHRKLQELHAKHGPIVWIAPDEISVSDPKLRSTIYGFADERKEQTFFPKAHVFETGQINEDFNFVFETDPKKARLGKYAMSHAYSERGLALLEPEFDRAVKDLVDGLNEHHMQHNRPANLGKWCHYFMYDLCSLLCSGYTSGLCNAGADKDDQIYSMRVIFEVVGGLVPVNFALKITTRWIRKMLLNSYLEHFFKGCLLNDEYYSKEERINKISNDRPQHLMSRFRAAETKMRKLFPLGNWTEAITNNIFFIYAGSTVASNAFPRVLQIIYNHPDALEKIRVEIASLPNVAVTTACLERTEGKPCRIPYLEAAVLEALRLTPTFGLTLSRTVPPVGCKLNKYFIPPGYSVGMSGWAVNYDPGYFGADAAEFKPERWLGNHPTETAKDGTGLPRTMRNYLEAGWFAFGAGARVCVGRHMTMIAFTKAVAEITKKYDVEVLKDGKDWYALVVHTDGMMVRLKPKCMPQSDGAKKLLGLCREFGKVDA